MAKLVSIPPAVRARRRWLSGLPAAERTQPTVVGQVVDKLLHGPSLWVWPIAVAVYATMLWMTWVTFASTDDRPRPPLVGPVLAVVPWLTLVLGLLAVVAAVLRYLRPGARGLLTIAAAAGSLALASALTWGAYAYWRSIDTQRQGKRGGIPWDVIDHVIPWAVYTLLAWMVVYFLCDRWRPQRLLVWFLALGWGGAVAVFGSLVVNSWASELIGAKGIEEMTGARSAVYVAPFVEEFFKATVLFWLAIALRYRLVNRLSMISLAGLSAAGFAFTENIVYYARAYSYAGGHQTATPEQVLKQMFLLRGVMTAWGHPFFTTLTGIGLAIGLSARSKTIRVLAPVSGFFLAALGHMFFNSMASTTENPTFYLLTGASIVLGGLVTMVTTSLMTGRLIRARLTDYVTMGWLPEKDIKTFGTWSGRFVIILKSLFSWQTAATIAMIRAETELAYLRDGITKGRIDKAGLDRERELFAQIRSLRPRAFTDRKAPHRKLWGSWRRAPLALPAPAPSYPGPAGLGGNWPAPAPVPARTQYSAVDPSWGPPA